MTLHKGDKKIAESDWPRKGVAAGRCNFISGAIFITYVAWSINPQTTFDFNELSSGE